MVDRVDLWNLPFGILTWETGSRLLAEALMEKCIYKWEKFHGQLWLTDGQSKKTAGWEIRGHHFFTRLMNQPRLVDPGLILVSVKVHESKIWGNDAPSYVNPENLAPRNAQGFGFRINSDSLFLVNMLGSNFRPLPISGSRFLWIFQSSSFGHIQFHSSLLWQQSQEDCFSCKLP